MISPPRARGGGSLPASGGRTRTAALQLVNATIGYGSRPVVLDASLEIATGEVVALLGPNGAGKTTLVRGLVGLADVLSGEVLIQGRAPAGPRSIGYVPQRLGDSGGIPTTAAEVVGAGLLARGRTWWWSLGGGPAVAAALAEVGLDHRSRVPVTELSGGQQRRVLIARALVSGPALLLLDEPTAGVDRASVLALAATLQDLKSAGRTLLIVTHELEALGDVVDRVVTLTSGRLTEGPPGTGGPLVVGGH